MIGDFLATIKARWRLELGIVLAVMLLVFVWIWMTPKVYSASASLLYDVTQPEPIAAGGSSPSDDELLGTQADVIRSETIAAAVVDRTGLGSSPNLIDQWRRATNGAVEFNAWMGKRLLGSLLVTPIKGSRVLGVEYHAADPVFAAQMANAFATTYVEERLRMQTDPAKTYAQWFEERTREVRQKLDKAQGALTAFQRRTGIVDSGSLDAEANRLTALSSSLVGAETSAATVGAKTGGSASQSNDVQSSPVVQQLRSQIASQTAQIAQMRATMGPNHPAMLAANAEIGALKSKLATEIGEATRSLKLASNSASATASDLRGKLNEQRGRMLSLAGDRGELIGLQRDVDSARANFDAVTQRLNSMRLQSSVPSTNVRQLDSALPPVLPSSPNVPLRVVLGLAFGVLLAVGIVGLLEFWRPRVRTEEGLENATNIVVLTNVNFSGSTTERRLIGQVA